MKKFYILALSALVALAANAFSPKLTYLGAEVPAKITPEKPEKFVIDQRNLRVMGHAVNVQPVQTVKAQNPQAVDMWETLEGTCTFTDDAFTVFFSNIGLVPRTWDVTVQKHKAMDIYRVADPYAGDAFFEGRHTADANRYLYLNAEDPEKVFFCDETGSAISYFDTGVNVGYGNCIITTAANLNLVAGEETTDDMYAKLRYGAFEFPEGVLGASFLNLVNQMGYSATNLNGKMRIALPDAKDYSCDLSFGHYAVRDKSLIIYLEIGADVATAKLGTFANEPWISINTVSPIMAIQGEPVKAGGYNIDVSGVTSRTTATFVLVCYDADGNIVSYDYSEVVVDGVDDDDWVTLEGEGEYMDGVYANIYNGVSPQAYNVTVQEHKNYKGYFRVVNPYTNGNWTAASAIGPAFDTSQNYYLYVDAMRPGMVFIEDSPLGVNFGDGEGMISSLAFVYHCYDQDATDYYGTRDENGLITFPDGSITFSEKGYYNGARLPIYNASTNPNIKSPVTLLLPASWSGIIGVIADDNTSAPVEYYNLQGMRVQDAENIPGLYIRKQGDKTEKVFLK